MGGPVRPVPITQRLVGQGPCALPGCGTKPGGGVRVPRPTEGLQGARKNGRGRTPSLRRVTWGAVKRGVGDAGPYGRFARSLRGGRPRGSPLRRGYKKFGKWAAGDMQEGASLRPPFGFSGKKIPASKAGSILSYYGGGDNARKNFVGGEILSHTMIFF